MILWFWVSCCAMECHDKMKKEAFLDTFNTVSHLFSDCLLTMVMKTLAVPGGSVQQADITSTCQAHFSTGINLTILKKYVYAWKSHWPVKVNPPSLSCWGKELHKESSYRRVLKAEVCTLIRSQCCCEWRFKTASKSLIWYLCMTLWVWMRCDGFMKMYLWNGCNTLIWDVSRYLSHAPLVAVSTPVKCSVLNWRLQFTISGAFHIKIHSTIWSNISLIPDSGGQYQASHIKPNFIIS